ncbi:MAG: stage III sporulation protein AC [Clostridia bacterium]|nr:stage III sporulation protein AC [Clostridia bacterium]
MQIEILIKLAGLGLLVSVITAVLKQSGREELSALVVVAGLVMGTVMMLGLVSDLMDTIRRVFSLY